MKQGLASLEATRNFFKNKNSIVPSSVKECPSFAISSLGLGTYKPEAYKDENYEFSYVEAIKKAVDMGCNHIDTAANYRYTKSEQEIGEALGSLFENGIKREELVVATKGGFLPLSYPFPENPYHWIGDTIIKSGLAKEEEIVTDEHCMSVDFIEWSLEASLGRLGLQAVDVFYIHNPEFELGIVAYPELLKKFGAIAKMLEQKRKDGKLGAYGIASWNGFLNEPSHMEYLSLADFVEVAATHGNGLRFLQTPFNPAKPHGYMFANQKVDGEFMPAFYAAKKLGLEVVTSSSLLQMNLFKSSFNEGFRDACNLGLASDLQRALQFARSNPLSLSALVGASSIEHIEHDFAILAEDPVPVKSYDKFFRL
jgi:aryl-alcohol dehydrogenase-like predicted oxidoreductase